MVMTMLYNLTYELFLDLKESNQILIIYFGNLHCGPCQMYKPNLEKLQQENIDNIVIYQVDTSVESQVTSLFKIESIPTTVFYYNNHIYAKEVGYRSVQNLKNIIASIPLLLNK